MKNRIYLFDNIKFLLILSVLIGHMAEAYTDDIWWYKALFVFIYSFHMPLFFFVSGIFHTQKNISKKIISYIAVYMVMKTMMFIVNYIFKRNLSFSLLSENGSSWFIFALAAFILITYVCQHMNYIYIIMLSVFIACMAGYDKSIGDFLVLSRIIVFLPFYLLGYLSTETGFVNIFYKNKNRIIQGVCAGIIVTWGIVCLKYVEKIYILQHLFTGRNSYNDSVINIGWITRLVCYVISCVICFAIIYIMPNLKINMISLCGQRSMQIYFWEAVFRKILIYLGIADVIVHINIYGPELWLGCGVFLTFLLGWKLFGYVPTILIETTKHENRVIDNSTKV